MARLSSEEFRGVMAAVLTPLKDDLGPDHETWLAHCRWLMSEGCHGLAVLGTTSEANSFSLAERLEMLDVVGESDLPGENFVPGTGCCAIPDTVALTRKALEIGAAGVLMLPPFYYKPVDDDGLFAAYSEVIERVGDARLRVLLYHIPQNTGVPISLGLIERLIKSFPETVVGIKDSAGDFANMKAMCDAFPGFRVFSGSDAFLLDVLEAGGAGAITACNNVCARVSAAVFDHWETPKGKGFQAELSGIRKTIQAFPLIEALKETMARSTGHDGWRTLRPPLHRLDAETRKRLSVALNDIGFTMNLAA